MHPDQRVFRFLAVVCTRSTVVVVKYLFKYATRDREADWNQPSEPHLVYGFRSSGYDLNVFGMFFFVS